MKYAAILILTLTLQAETCDHATSGNSLSVSPTLLKYKLINSLGDVAFCDPDFFPVIRPALEMQHAVELFDSLKNRKEEFSAITSMLKMNTQNYSDSDKLKIYREHKRLSTVNLKEGTNSYSFSINTKENDQTMWHYEGTITPNGKISVTKKDTFILRCPICLPGNTSIKTPSGNVAVSNLKTGDEVISFDNNHHFISEKIIQTSKIPVPEFHELIQVELRDGRVVTASPGHPFPDGKLLEEIKIGDVIDGSTVKNINLIFSKESFTYDILPDGPTGFYIANGIELGSTLKAIIVKK